MTTQALARPLAPTRLLAGARLHWLTIAGAAWLLFGLYWDGWAHINDLPDSFWTIWHAAFYSGYGALAVVIAGSAIADRPQVRSWAEAIPRGYGWAIVGVVVFGIGGALDAIWHTVFGIEASTEALISPSHLVLAVGMILMVSAPLRAAWLDPRPRTFVESLPAVLSLTAVFSLFTFMTMFAGAYSSIVAQGGTRSFGAMEENLGAVYFWTVLLMGHVLVALRAGTLPPGSLVILLGANAAAMILMRGHASAQVQATMILVAVLAGAAGDVVLRRLRPSIERDGALRAFAFALPAIYWALYLGAVATFFGTWWRPHSLLGVPLIAGVIGLLMSAVLLAPARRADAPR